MTPDYALKDIKLHDCQQMLAKLVSPGACLTLLDSNGQIVQTCTSDNGLDDKTSAPPITTTGEKSYVKTILSQANEGVGSIKFSVPAKSHLSSVDFELICNSIAQKISVEYQLNSELNAMAIELGERYEELNLIYKTRDRIQHFIDDQSVLNQLIKNCVDYLNVHQSTLYLPLKRIVIEHLSPQYTTAGNPPISRNLVNSVFNWLDNQHRSIIINHIKDSPDKSIVLPENCKILACPIFENNNDIAGIILVANPNNTNHFTNSDRNLLEVIAHNISKLLHKNYDSLTGLMNRDAFEYYLDQEILDCKSTQEQHVLMWIDIDRLQVLNDTLSYTAGDEMIRNIAKILEKYSDNHSLIARTEGGKFALLLKKRTLRQGKALATSICQAITTRKFTWEGNAMEASVSIGLTSIDSEVNSVNTALTEAEIASNLAEEAGRNGVQVYDRNDKRLTQRKNTVYWAARIQTALRENEFVIYSQTIQALDQENNVNHQEILLRLIDKDKNVLLPGAFMKAAESYHLMPAIDHWVIKNTLSLLCKYKNIANAKNTLWSINLSGQSLGNSKLTSFIQEQLSINNISAHNICFEITETAAISSMGNALLTISGLKALGCRFSLDDFGTGLSSFSYLRELPVDYVKIDGSFVKEILTDPISAAMVTSINEIGHVMGLKTIAEFVESDAIRNKLVEIGVDYGQGYGIDKPQALEEKLQLASSKNHH